MLEIYGVEGNLRNDLMQTAREARQKGWWHAYVDVPQTTFIGIEAEVASIATYHSQIIPGLVQTADYARAVMHSVLIDLRDDEIERRVDLRITRQEKILMQEDPPMLWMVLDEAALRRVVGGLEIMVRQLEHLIEIATLPSVTLQVLPFAAGEHAGIDGTFVIYGFAEPADPAIVYLENPVSDFYLDKPEAVRRYSRLFDHIRAAALAPDDSVKFLSKLFPEMSEGSRDRYGAFPHDVA
jgi:hypothetical protein